MFSLNTPYGHFKHQLRGSDERRHLRWLRNRIAVGVVLQKLAVESFFTVRQALERNVGFHPNPRVTERTTLNFDESGEAASAFA